MPKDPLLLENKSRFNVLVVEDDHESGLNALSGLSAHNVLLAKNLEEALPTIARAQLDFVISDVHFPDEQNGKPKENIVPLMHAALQAHVPVCFVTRGDHHGLTEKDEGYVAIKPVTIGGLTQTLMGLTSGRAGNGKAFPSVKSANPETIRANAKTPEIWARALEMLRNACTSRPDCIALAARQVRDVLGVNIGVENGLPVLKPRRG